MNIYIRGEKLEITDAMKSYAKEKLERLSKYVKDSDVNANLLFKINSSIIFSILLSTFKIVKAALPPGIIK